MPETEIKKRGGALRYRTITVRTKDGRRVTYRIAVVRRPGPRGGRTIAKRITT